jgi:hypothetical protein
MYELVEDADDIGDLNSWLAFEGRDRFDPIQDGWITVNRHGHHRSETNIGTVEQGFRIHAFLVDEEDLDTIVDTDPFGEIGTFDFNPMAYGSRRRDGQYWEEDLTRSVDGVEAKRFVMDFRKDAPLPDTGFIEYHNLIEREKRNFETYDTDETVVRFPHEKWEYLSSQSSHLGLANTIRSLEVRAEFLKDYLKQRGCALVLAYFQSRDVRETHEDISLPDDDREEFAVRGGKAVRGVRRNQPGYELHWFCPIRADDIPYGREERLQEDRENLKFETKQGYRFSKKEAANEVGFDEAGYRRPAIGAEDLEEAISFFGWTYFEPEVLEKYKNDSRGTVSEWSRQGLQVNWLDKMKLRAYRNNQDLILIIVDDLIDIPDEELSHWYHYNTSPAGEIPEEMITNYIEADWVDSESPSDAVINAVTELNEAFKRKYGVRLYRETGDEIDADRMLSLPRNEKHELLTVMSEAHQAIIENLDRDNLESQLPEEVSEDVEGKKSALFEFVKDLSDTNTAAEILDPINAVHDFRKEDSHMTVSSGGWPRAVDALGYEEDSEAYRDMYRDAMRQSAASLREITALIEEDSN